MTRHPPFAAAALVAAVAAAAAGCHEATGPSPLALSLSAASQLVVLPNDSGPAVTDSVRVRLSGSGAAGAHWTVSHGDAPWVTLGTTAGTGDGVVRWTRDPGEVVAGVWLDTITVSIAGSQGSASVVDSLVVTGPLPTHITVRRAWAPGERDSLVARMLRDSLDGTFVPAAVAELLAASDSVTEVVPNPTLAVVARAAPPGMIGAAKLSQAGETWIMVGYDLRELYPITPGSKTMDSLNLLGVIWYASPDSTWKGRVLAATTASTISNVAINTAAFDSSYETSGAGGAEARASTGNYWEANAGSMYITQNTCSPTSCANTTFTSGPWKGGVWHGLSVGGILNNIVAPCLLPAGCTAAPDTFDVSFFSFCFGNYCFGNPISGIAITCVFPSPCTGPAAARMAELAQRRTSLRQPFSPAKPETPQDDDAGGASDRAMK